jgi:hypothetical protein
VRASLHSCTFCMTPAVVWLYRTPPRMPHAQAATTHGDCMLDRGGSPQHRLCSSMYTAGHLLHMLTLLQYHT